MPDVNATNAPLGSLDEWEDFVLDRYPERSFCIPMLQPGVPSAGNTGQSSGTRPKIARRKRPVETYHRYGQEPGQAADRRICPPLPRPRRDRFFLKPVRPGFAPPGAFAGTMP